MGPKKESSQKVDPPKKSKRSSKRVEETSESEEDFEAEEIEVKIEKVMKKVMNDFKRDFKKEIKMELQEFEKSLTYTSDKIDEVLLEMKHLKDKQLVLENENKMLKEKVKKMESAMEDLEQYSRNRNIQIDGIPNSPNEDLGKIVKEIGKEINVDFKDGEIDVVHRIPTRNKTNPEPIVVQLLSRNKRDEILMKAKQKKITTTALNFSGNERTIFINEHLTRQRKTLLYEAKQKRNELNFKFTWTKGGKIFMRKDEKCNVIQIHSLEDLQNLHH